MNRPTLLLVSAFAVVATHLPAADRSSPGSALVLRDRAKFVPRPDPLPHVTGLPGVFEAPVPPRHADMRAGVEAAVARKFGAGCPFGPKLDGPTATTPASARGRSTTRPWRSRS